MVMEKEKTQLDQVFAREGLKELTRQLLAEEGNLESKKVDEANHRLKRVNRAVEFTGYAISLDKLLRSN